MSIIGELAAYDHWRQRVTLVANVLLPPGASDAQIDDGYDDAIARIALMKLQLVGLGPAANKLPDEISGDDVVGSLPSVVTRIVTLGSPVIVVVVPGAYVPVARLIDGAGAATVNVCVTCGLIV